VNDERVEPPGALNVASYTADAVAILVYLVDALPAAAEDVFARAEAGEAIISAPSTVLAEVLYAVSRDKDVRGVRLAASPEEIRRTLLVNGPVSLAPVGDAELREYCAVVDEFTIHDALVVASHRAAETDAILTSDETIRAATVETVWD
jgi:predicted nucleic acid-binding protein